MTEWLKKYRVWLISFAIIILLACLYAIITLGLILSSRKDQSPKDIDYLIVLGAQVWGKEPAYPSPQLQERLDTAFTYLSENPSTMVIVTGGQGSDEAEPEADVMARYLIALGIDKEQILIENQSTSTIENFVFTLEMVETDTAVVVTNDYHMYRAKRTAKQNGLTTVYGLSAPSRTGSTFKSYVREVFALGYHLIFSH